MQLKQNSKNFISAIALAFMVSGCSTVSSLWSNDEPEATIIKEDNSNRIDIMSNVRKISTSEGALDGLSRADSMTPDIWTQEGGIPRQAQGHISGALLKKVKDKARIGDGNTWLNAALAAAPVLTDTHVFAMDGRGIITAHDISDIDDIAWRSAALKSTEDLLVGGLATDGKRLYGVIGNGQLAAFDINTGATIWKRNLGVPLRSSLRYHAGQIFLTTADSQLICYNAKEGTIQWQHRGIGETANLFGSALPAINADHVIIAYQSGELFGLRRNDGKILWADALQRQRRTMAIGNFTGIDANPILSGNGAITAASSGLIIANNVQNGRRIWEQPIGTRHAPWLDGGHLYMITEDDQLAAMSAINGKIGWIEDMPANETPRRFYGPFMLNDTLIVLDQLGKLYQFDVTGKIIRQDSLIGSLAASPAFVGEMAYMVGRDATLYQVK